MAQSQKSVKVRWATSWCLTSNYLKVAAGSGIGIPISIIRCGLPARNSVSDILLSLSTSNLSKFSHRKQYSLRQLKRKRNQPFETQSSPWGLLDFILPLAAWKARMITGLASKSSGRLRTSLIPLSTSAKLKNPLPFMSNWLQISILLRRSQGLSPIGIALIFSAQFPIQQLQDLIL